MSSYNPLQLYLSLVSAREEMIFLVRIMSHQMQSENRNKVGTLREIQEEILRGEHRREALESSLLEHLTEGHRKLFFPKILQKTQKINMFFLNKTQIYFPKQGQLLCQEQINAPNLRHSVQNMMHENVGMTLKYISNLQRQKLRNEMSRLMQIEKEDRCNRNEKFFSEPLLLGVRGVKYLNQIHFKYFYSTHARSTKNVYDVLQVDEQSKSLYLQGGGIICTEHLGFRSLISSITKIKDSVKEQDPVYVPVESTLEIITQRYEKMLKEFQEANSHVNKSINRYFDQFDKYRKRKPFRRPSVMKPSPLVLSQTPKPQRMIKITTQKHASITTDCKSQQLVVKRMILPLNDNLISPTTALTDGGRLSEPIYKHNIADTINTVRHLRLRLPPKYRSKNEDTQVRDNGGQSPTHILTESLPISSLTSTSNLNRNQYIKAQEFQILKPATLQPTQMKPYYDVAMRIGSSRKSRYNYDIH